MHEKYASHPGFHIGAAGHERLSQQNGSLLLEGLILHSPHLTLFTIVSFVPA